MNAKLVAIVQARTGSTRLPGKTLRLLAGVPMIEHIIGRLRQVTRIDQIVLAVPDLPSEAPLLDVARRLNITTCKGPEEDVLKRFILAGEAAGAEHVLRVCGDSPLIDPNLIDALLENHCQNQADYTMSSGLAPLGTSAEAVRLATLKQIAETAVEQPYREHVTAYIHDHPNQFKVCSVAVPKYLLGKSFRLTVDTEADFLLMERIYREFFTPSHPIVDLERVIPYLETHPETARLNADVKQKDWRLEK